MAAVAVVLEVVGAVVTVDEVRMQPYRLVVY